MAVRSKLGANATPLIKPQVYKGRPQQRPAMQSPIKHFVNKSENSSKISRLYRPNFNNKLETTKSLSQKTSYNASHNNYLADCLKYHRLEKELAKKYKHKSFVSILFPSLYWENEGNAKPSRKLSNIRSSFRGHNGRGSFRR